MHLCKEFKSLNEFSEGGILMSSIDYCFLLLYKYYDPKILKSLKSQWIMKEKG